MPMYMTVQSGVTVKLLSHVAYAFLKQTYRHISQFRQPFDRPNARLH